MVRRIYGDQAGAINDICSTVNELALERGWWDQPLNNPLVVPTKMALIHSEISEALEGYRKDKMDDHLTARSATEVELADACIRIFDLAAQLGLDLGGAIAEKHAYNMTRVDHSKEAREAAGGKKF